MGADAPYAPPPHATSCHPLLGDYFPPGAHRAAGVGASGAVFDGPCPIEGNKVWQDHTIATPDGDDAADASGLRLLGIDLHLVHEVTSPQAFAELARQGLRTADLAAPGAPSVGTEEMLDAVLARL